MLANRSVARRSDTPGSLTVASHSRIVCAISQSPVEGRFDTWESCGEEFAECQWPSVPGSLLSRFTEEYVNRRLRYVRPPDVRGVDNRNSDKTTLPAAKYDKDPTLNPNLG